MSIMREITQECKMFHVKHSYVQTNVSRETSEMTSREISIDYGGSRGYKGFREAPRGSGGLRGSGGGPRDFKTF